MSPTAELRWVEQHYTVPPVLQQKWVQHHVPAGQTEAPFEWRDLPTVKEES